MDYNCRFEQAYLSSILATEQDPHWIGLHNQNNSDNGYEWTSYRPVTYTNWYRFFTGKQFK